MGKSTNRSALPDHGGWSPPRFAPLPFAAEVIAPPESSQPDANRALDGVQLLERCLGSRPLAERVLRSFAERFWEDAAPISVGLTSAIPEVVAKAAHRLKGAAANAAAAELAEIAAEIETAAGESQLGRAREFWAKLEPAWSRFLAARATWNT